MPKSHGNPFMEYDICHDLWLSPKFRLPTFGFMIGMENIFCTAFWGGINYRLWVLISCNGGQGGRVNVPWEMGIQSPNIGLMRRYASFAFLLGKICSSLWSEPWCEVWSLVVLRRYVL